MDKTYQIDAAIEAWRSQLGTDQVKTGTDAQIHYGANTIGVKRRIPAGLLPKSRDQLVEALRIARKFRVPVYPISTGNNWGYGSANPVTNDTVVLDLSNMNRVLDMDPDSGLVTVEPGVTQRQLRDYLDEHEFPFLVPVTGAGPDCSLLGNAVERGYGITPYADHFSAVMAVEAVLPDGRVYKTPLTELGGEEVDRAFKWGVGPYFDGLFTQSNFGVVTQMTIALAPNPARVEAFFFGISEDSHLEKTVLCIQEALREVGSVVGSINLMNKRRVLSMMEPYPAGHKGPNGIIPDALLNVMAKRNQTMEWTGAGALYGNRKIVKAARSVIRKKMKPVAKRLMFFTPTAVNRLYQLSNFVPGRLGKQASHIFLTLDKTLRLLAGNPSEIALPLAYWKSETKPASGSSLNPARDGCGLIWYSPLVKMSPQKVRTYTDIVNSVCRNHGIEPLITLTSLSDRCFDSTVPLLFDPKNEQERERAQACYNELFDTGQKEGFIPYRTDIRSMQKYTDTASTYWNLAREFKRIVDKENIIAPGRYSLID